MSLSARLLTSRSAYLRRLPASRPLSTLSSPLVQRPTRHPAKRRASIRTFVATTPSWVGSAPTETEATPEAPPPASTQPAPSRPSSAIRQPPRPAARPIARPIVSRPVVGRPNQPATHPRTPPRAPPSVSDPAEPAAVDWSSSYHGVSSAAFPPEVAAILHRPLDPADVEIKPDGIVFLPEIKYRNILFEAFGPGGWGMVPKGEPEIMQKMVTREWALMVHGRFISQSRGENNYFGEDQIPRAIEACKSNALMRCCKDLGIAAELWDKRFVRSFKEAYAHEMWVEHVVTKKKAKIWLKKEDRVEYPFKVAPPVGIKRPASG